MADEKKPIVIKKYANRRLYNTGTSTYVTLEDLAVMVKNGDEFTVCDAKSGDDITRSVLAQIIFDQEGKEGQNLLPLAFLRQLIRFYGDSMQMLVPSYLEFSLDKLASEQNKFREQMASSMGGGTGMPAQHMFGAMEEQARKNMQMFSQALSLFNPFAVGGAAQNGAPQGETSGEESSASQASRSAGDASRPADKTSAERELEAMRRQLAEMQKTIDGLSNK